jgi:hypothetical protein
MTGRAKLLAWLAASIVAGSTAGPAWAQTQEPPARDEAITTAAALRERLGRAIERGEAMLERHREALERLEAGESPAEVLRSLRWREFSRETDRRSATEPGEPSRRRGRVDAARETPAPPRGGGADARGPDTADRDDEIGPEGRRRLRAFLRDHLPSVDEQLAQVEAMDAETGARLFDRLLPQLREVASDTERDPSLGALKLEEMRAGLAVVDATQNLRSLGPDAAAGARSEAEAALRGAIASRFDARIRLREHELERLAARIAELHDQIKREQASRDAEITRVYQAVIAQRWARPAPDRRGETPAGEHDGRP